jgi:hypothetical protein
MIVETPKIPVVKIRSGDAPIVSIDGFIIPNTYDVKIDYAAGNYPKIIVSFYAEFETANADDETVTI